MKEDVLEQVVDDYLKFKGYFTTHNVTFVRALTIRSTSGPRTPCAPTLMSSATTPESLDPSAWWSSAARHGKEDSTRAQSSLSYDVRRSRVG